jgi:hypothetical protein
VRSNSGNPAKVRPGLVGRNSSRQQKRRARVTTPSSAGSAFSEQAGVTVGQTRRSDDAPLDPKG